MVGSRAFGASASLMAAGEGREATDERTHQKVLSRLQEVKAIRDAETATFGLTFIQDTNGVAAFSGLSPYETTIDPGLYKLPVNSNVSRRPAPINRSHRAWPLT